MKLEQALPWLPYFSFLAWEQSLSPGARMALQELYLEGLVELKVYRSRRPLDYDQHYCLTDKGKAYLNALTLLGASAP